MSNVAGACAMAAALVGVALAARAVVQPWMGSEEVFFVFLVPVLLAAYLGGYRVGACALTFSLAGLGYFYFPLVFSGDAQVGVEIVKLVLLALVGAGMIATIEALHRARHRDRLTILELSETKRVLRETVIEAGNLRAALDEHAIVAFTDARGKITFANDRFCALSGYSRTELIGQDHRLINSGYHSREFFADFWRTLNAGRAWHGEIRNRAKDGSYYWVDTTVVPLPDGPGVHRFIAIRADITRRKAAELALKESEQRFRQLAENIREVFWIYEPETDRTLYVSPAYTEISGLPMGDPMADRKAWMAAIHPEDQARVRSALLGGAAATFEETYRLVRPDGTIRWVQDRGYPLRDETGRVFRIVGTAEDITERRELQNQLFESQKLEAIGTLAGGIAHDFNNILGGIIGYTELVKLRVTHDPLTTRHLDSVLTAGRRAADLVRQILAFSRHSDHGLQDMLRLRPLVSETLKLLRASIPTTIEFDVQLEDVAPVRADPSQIHQVLLNLCTNATRAMQGEKGTLTVALANHLVTSAQAAILPALRVGPYVRLMIADTGEGMSPELTKRIFEPFFTTREPGEGSGLGLSVVHGIVQSHRGVIEVQSRPGKGSRFILYFPVQSSEVADTSGREAEPPPPGLGQHILFVDDEKPLVELGRCVLEELGYRVTVSTRAEEVLRCLQAEPHAVDLVITDYTMPGMTGIDLARALRGVRVDLPILLTTGHAATLSAESACAAGIAEILPKPFDLKSLGHSVHRALRAAAATETISSKRKT